MDPMRRFQTHCKGFIWLEFPWKQFRNRFGKPVYRETLKNIPQYCWTILQPSRFGMFSNQDVFISFLSGTRPWTLVWFLKLHWQCCSATHLVCPLVCGCTHWCKYILALLWSVRHNLVPRIPLTSGQKHHPGTVLIGSPKIGSIAHVGWQTPWLNRVQYF